jgi:hypothetical protein
MLELTEVIEYHPVDDINVYNFEVEGDHTYFVGNGDIWVHNEGYMDVGGVTGKIMQIMDGLTGNTEANKQLFKDVHDIEKSVLSPYGISAGAYCDSLVLDKNGRGTYQQAALYTSGDITAMSSIGYGDSASGAFLGPATNTTYSPIYQQDSDGVIQVSGHTQNTSVGVYTQTKSVNVEDISVYPSAYISTDSSQTSISINFSLSTSPITSVIRQVPVVGPTIADMIGYHAVGVSISGNPTIVSKKIAGQTGN